MNGTTATAVGFDTLLGVHGKTVTLSPSNSQVVAVIEHVTPTPMLHKLNWDQTEVTHNVHIKRSSLSSVNIELVTGVSLSSRQWRVDKFTNDPNQPQVTFHCFLKPS